MARAFKDDRLDCGLLAKCLLCVVATVALAVLLLLAIWFVGIPVFGVARDFAGAGDSLLPPGFQP